MRGNLRVSHWMNIMKCDVYTKYSMNKEITLNQMHKDKSQLNLPYRSNTTPTHLYTTGRLKIMRCTQNIVGQMKPSQLKVPEYDIQFKKYL
jgi:hypothetical protein